MIFTEEHGVMVPLHGFIKKMPKIPKRDLDLALNLKKRRRCMKKKNVGSSFDSWLRKEGICEEVSATAIKRVLSRQVEFAIKEKGLSKAEMARRMHTSYAALNRLLDP
jgi:antitoxin HicB